ncbi:S-linalool synthase-like [Rhodamnia argentea]|uniref:S-linalool synthase-like n=1 Tax=Rhodamnia argentea TaxID=178133 RepID=A0A8B8P292_9MYRT|nr:S-linalool synthase-like [Rhodamnia argentea]
MESQKPSIQSLVNKIKREVLARGKSLCSFLSPSPYDTAWLAMIPDPRQHDGPMFKGCLNWVLRNQNEEGFWGDYDHGEHETSDGVECLASTLVCMTVLKKWHVGSALIEKGLNFIHENTELFLARNKDEKFPRWVAILLPGMVDLAHAAGLEIEFPESAEPAIADLFSNRRRLLETEEVADPNQYYPLLSYLEALPPTYKVGHESILKHLDGDGSLFQSPSATSGAYLATGNEDCLAYLQSLASNCASNGVPSLYLVDEELTKLSMVHQLVRLGLTEYFDREKDEILAQIYRNYKHEKLVPKSIHSIADKLCKDCLEFWLLRMHGYSVSPSSICWFLDREEVRDRIEKHYEHFSSVFLYIYRASNLMLPGERQLEEARAFSKKFLEKIASGGTRDGSIVSSSHCRMIEHELGLPWMARLDHLEHRMWMEEKDACVLWRGKFSCHRSSLVHNQDIMQLALQNFELRQSVYRLELDVVKRWSGTTGLSKMGFGREKTTYTYFAVATSISLPCNSDVRVLVAKSAIVITVADDFFDMEGSLEDLEKLTDAVQRWDGEGLSGHADTIFNALDDLVTNFRVKCFQQSGKDIKENLRHIWGETFQSWLMEAKWSRSGGAPTTQEYLDVGMTSIAAHTLVLPSSCLASPATVLHQLWSDPYHTIAKLLMVITRLLNDIQSYRKEEKEGKLNFVLLYLKENPEANIEDSIKFVQLLIDQMKKEFLQHVLDRDSNLPEPSRRLHLGCLKVFHMFFNSSNRYDSDMDMLHDIHKALVMPPLVPKSKPLRPLPEPPGPKPRVFATKSWSGRFDLDCFPKKSFIKYRTSSHSGPAKRWEKMYKSSSFRLCFA